MNDTIEELKAKVELLEAQVEEKEREIYALSSPERTRLISEDQLTYTPPRHGWVCFHCGETTMTYREARAHFGSDPRTDITICQKGER